MTGTQKIINDDIMSPYCRPEIEFHLPILHNMFTALNLATYILSITKYSTKYASYRTKNDFFFPALAKNKRFEFVIYCILLSRRVYMRPSF